MSKSKRPKTLPISYRFRKLNSGTWQLIEIKNGSESVLFTDVHNIVFGKYQRIVLAQPLEPLND